MFRLAANLSTLFTELSVEERFAAAARAGFSAIEMQFPYSLAPTRIADLLNANGLELVLFNAPAGDLASGDRGLAFADEVTFLSAIEQAIIYASATGCGRIHVLIGNGAPDDRVIGNLKQAAKNLADYGITMMLEALNEQDQPGYALPDIDGADRLRVAIDERNVLLQLDAYHLLRGGHDPIAAFRVHANRIGHIQVADPADRGEPAAAILFEFLDTVAASGWNGFVGAEYTPRGTTISGLDWASSYGVVPSGEDR